MLCCNVQKSSFSVFKSFYCFRFFLIPFLYSFALLYQLFSSKRTISTNFYYSNIFLWNLTLLASSSSSLCNIYSVQSVPEIDGTLQNLFLPMFYEIQLLLESKLNKSFRIFMDSSVKRTILVLKNFGYSYAFFSFLPFIL